MKDKNLSNRLERLLFELRISQKDFATKINLSYATVGRVLRGESLPSGSFLWSIQQAFPNINGDWLMTGNGSMFKENAPDSSAPVQELSKTVVTEEGKLLEEIRGMREEFKRMLSLLEFQAELLKKPTGNSKQSAGKIIDLPLGYRAA